MKRICVASALIIVTGRLLLAQEIPLAPATDARPAAEEKNKDSYVILSNLGAPGDLYNDGSVFASPVVGDKSDEQTEEWSALRFVPKVDVQAKVLSAAIGYIYGTKEVELALYSDDESFGSTPGTALPGGTGSTTDIPDLGDCCGLATVTLKGAGVKLTAGTNYWLVAMPDNVNAPDFYGSWQVTHTGDSAWFSPSRSWNPYSSSWLAAEIRGSRVPKSKSAPLAAPEGADMTVGNGQKDTTFFNNLGPNTASQTPYTVNFGAAIRGSQVFEEVENWEALPFTVTKSGHATILSAAIAIDSGTSEIRLGLYSDDNGVPENFCRTGKLKRPRSRPLGFVAI